MEEKEIIELCNKLVLSNLKDKSEIKCSELILGEHDKSHILMWIALFCNEEDSIYTIPFDDFIIRLNPDKTILFKIDGTITAVTPKDKYFTLRELQKYVNGYIEFYPERINNRLIICNEEGIIRNLPVNKSFHEYTGLILYGDILFCPTTLLDEELE